MSYTFTEIDQKTQQQCQFMSCNLTEIDYRKHNSSDSLCHTLSQKQIIENTIVMSVYVIQSHRNRLQKTQQQCQFMSCNLTEIDYRKHNSSVSLCQSISQKQIIENTIVVSVYVINFHRNRLENTIVVSVYVMQPHRNRLQKTQ